MNAMRTVSMTLEVARQTVRLLVQNRLFRLQLLAVVGVAALGFAIGFDPPRLMTGPRLYSLLAWWLLGFVLVPWTTLYFGVQMVHGDIEDRTFQYLFVRPVPRWAILLGKWLAVAVTTTVVYGGGAVLLFVALVPHAGLWSDGPELQLLLVFAAAMALLAFAYAAVACWLSAMFRWPLVLGAGFIVAGQALLGSLPASASIRHATITDPVRRFVLHGIDPDRRLQHMLWPSERDWNRELTGQPVLDLAVITGVTLLLALVSYGRKEYDSRQRE